METHQEEVIDKIASLNSRGKFKRCNKVLLATKEIMKMYQGKFHKEGVSHRSPKLPPILVARSWAVEGHSNKEDKEAADSLSLSRASALST